MTINDLDDHMRGWCERLSAREQQVAPPQPLQVKTETALFKGGAVEKVLKNLEVLGGTNCNTNRDNANV
jgi:hypothetical protein